MNYKVYEFATAEEVEQQVLMAVLDQLGFDSFEQLPDSLKAYTPKIVDPKAMQKLLKEYSLNEIEFEQSELEQRNWNEVWESNFEPVTIGTKVGIRAPFHAKMGTKYELVIEPKMSFGTGHHATTELMIEFLLTQKLKEKSVLDFGSGTGILAILAHKLGSRDVVAIDHEEWAYQNAIENAERNKATSVSVVLGDDTHLFTRKFDLMLANVNLHVILPNLRRWKNLVNEGGKMILSGLIVEDETTVIAEALQNGFRNPKVRTKDTWISIALDK